MWVMKSVISLWCLWFCQFLPVFASFCHGFYRFFSTVPAKIVFAMAKIQPCLKYTNDPESHWNCLIRHTTYQFLLVSWSNNVSILHYYWNITTVTSVILRNHPMSNRKLNYKPHNCSKHVWHYPRYKSHKGFKQQGNSRSLALAPFDMIY